MGNIDVNRFKLKLNGKMRCIFQFSSYFGLIKFQKTKMYILTGIFLNDKEDIKERFHVVKGS